MMKTISCYSIAFLFFTSSFGQEGLDVTAQIELGETSESATIKVTFDRDNSQEDQLLFTSLNISYFDPVKTKNSIMVDPIENYFSLFTGWFVIQQESQELWIGLNMPKSENKAEITLNVPGVVNFIENKYPEEYELNYSSSISSLPNLTGLSTSARYIQLKDISVSKPTWGEVDLENSIGWKKKSSSHYIPVNTPDKIHILRIKRNPTLWGDWSRKNLGSFGGGIAIGAILIVALFGKTKNLARKHRLFAFLIVLIAFIFLYLLNGLQPLNMRLVLYEGSHILGFVLPFIVLIAMPIQGIDIIKKFFIEVKNA